MDTSSDATLLDAFNMLEPVNGMISAESVASFLFTIGFEPDQDKLEVNIRRINGGNPQLTFVAFRNLVHREETKPVYTESNNAFLASLDTHGTNVVRRQALLKQVELLSTAVEGPGPKQLERAVVTDALDLALGGAEGGLDGLHALEEEDDGPEDEALKAERERQAVLDLRLLLQALKTKEPRQ